MLAGLKSTGMQMHAGMCVVDASSVLSVLAFLYLTAHSIIAYCGDLQGLMYANPQEQHHIKRVEAPRGPKHDHRLPSGPLRMTTKPLEDVLVTRQPG